MLEFLLGFDLLGEQFHVIAAQQTHMLVELLARQRHQIDLHKFGKLDQRFQIIVVDEIVQRHAVALRGEVAHASDDFRIGVDIFQDFQHDAVFRKRQRCVGGDEAAGEIDECARAADDLVQADFYEGVDDDLRGRLIAVEGARAVLGAATEQ